MAVKLFVMNGVPDDEAQEVRELLASNGIDFYETTSGNWGISVAAIWLRDESLHPQARSLIDEYQQGRLARAREEYALQQSAGKRRTIIDVVRENPLRFVVYLAAIAVAVYFSTKPFMDIGK
jgi:DNA primase